MKPKLANYLNLFSQNQAATVPPTNNQQSLHGSVEINVPSALGADQNNKSLVSVVSATTVSFQRAQSECAEQLDGLKLALSTEYSQLEEFLGTHTKSIVERLLEQNQRLKCDMIDLLNGIFEANASRITQALMPQIHHECLQADAVRSRMCELTRNIDQLKDQLQGPNYKNTIAQIVTSDIPAKIDELHRAVQQVKCSLKQRQFDIVVNQGSLHQIRKDLLDMYSIEQTLVRPQQAPRPLLLVTNNSLQPRTFPPLKNAIPPQQHLKSIQPNCANYQLR